MSETERVTLVGNLTADPELRFTPSGLPVTSLRIAVTPPHQAGGRHLDRWGDQLPHRQRLARPGRACHREP
jgi:single-strand DNA-binding protein